MFSAREHQQRSKINNTFNSAKWICTILSDIYIKDLSLQEHWKNTNRQYPPILIGNKVKTVRKLDIQTLRETKRNTTPHLRIQMFVSTPNLKNYKTNTTIVQTLSMLSKDPTYEQHPEIHVNLLNKKDKTTRWKYSWKMWRFTKQTRNRLVKICERRNCGACPNFLECSEFLFKPREWSTITTKFTSAPRI